MVITLLTAEEVEKLPKELRQCEVPKNFIGYELDRKCWWWLRSPGYGSSMVMPVDCAGSVRDYGHNADCHHGVRPALQNLTCDEITQMSKTKDGYIKFLGTKWIDISEYLGYSCLLKKKCLKKPHRFDKDSNDYETSEIKKIIEKWLGKKIDAGILYVDR